MKFPFFVALLALIPLRGFADVSLPALISDHMVLKKSPSAPIWGTADAGERVKVTLSGQTAETTAGPDGRWKLSLDLSQSAQGPFELVVEGKNKLTIADVMVGEVWVASGQSNMAWKLSQASGAEEEIAASATPLLRMFTVKNNASRVPLADVEGQWLVSSPETAGGFSAVGYFFGKYLVQDLRIPVGVINSSWGGTPSEAWTSEKAIDSVPELAQARKDQQAALDSFPEAAKSYVAALSSWAEENERADKPTPDVPAYTGDEISPTDWVAVRVPGEIAGKGLPASGVTWLRKEVELNAPGAATLHLPLDGFTSVYWNGKLLSETSLENFATAMKARNPSRYQLPASDVKIGKNILAVRVYHPLEPAKFAQSPRLETTSLDGEWKAKAEAAWPTPEPAVVAALPQPPPPPPRTSGVASYLFNGMVHPLLPFAISGAIWYQGEANAGRAHQYQTAFPLMISDWREQWKQGDFPFYFCQLANYREKLPTPADSSWAELREAQQLALALPNTGQAVLIDLGESGDIHPRNKKDVGRRLADLALNKTYGKQIVSSGPVYDSMKVEGARIVLRFEPSDSALVALPLGKSYPVRTAVNSTAPLLRNSPESQLEGFEICGEDRKWVWADAKIEGDSVVVWSERVPSPVAVRYAWANNPTCNLGNAAGMPASPFRTDDFPGITEGAKLGVTGTTPPPKR